ncbi:MAG: BlaI/MecI/CopY family transcriptional regulator [Planctomycetaceae bacterium]
MARPPSSLPTDVELEILHVLWETGAATLGEVCQALQRQRAVAKTTVATMLAVMLEKKLVSRKRSPRGFEWKARVSRNAAADGMLAKLLNGVFDGSARRLVMHLVESGELTPADRRELGRLLATEGRERSSSAKTPPKGGTS